MDAVVLVIALLAFGAVVSGGMYFTFRGFRAANRQPVEAKPSPALSNGRDAATLAQLKRFFEGKQCAACSRPIPPVHAYEVRPGLLHTKTRETIPWDDIPTADLSTTLASHEAICSDCAVAETFRRQHPDLVVDRRRPVGHPTH
jgi:hypothetical protein